jgi:AcrR family transcriptional regulator
VKKSDFEDSDTPYAKGTRFSGTKNRVIGATLKFIAKGGATAFSLNQILKLSGVSKGSFFHHFKNLDELLLACFDECKTFTQIDFDAIESSSIENLLLAFGYETLSHTTSFQFLRIVMFFGEKAAVNERYREKQRELTQYYIESVSSAILKLNCDLEESRVHEAVSFLLVVNQGIASHRVFFKDHKRMESVWPFAVQTALTIMGASSKKARSDVAVL